MNRIELFMPESMFCHEGNYAMRKIKRILSGILFAVFITSVFAACGMQKELLPKDEKTTANTSASTTTQPAETTTIPAEQEGDAYINQNKIDLEYQSAIETVRNLKQYEITQDYAQRWKREMEINLQKLTNVLSDEHKKLLETAQDGWEAYAKNELKLAYAYSDILNLSTDSKMEHNAKSYYDIYRGRAIELYRYRQLILEKFGDVPYYESKSE